MSSSIPVAFHWASLSCAWQVTRLALQRQVQVAPLPQLRPPLLPQLPQHPLAMTCPLCSMRAVCLLPVTCALWLAGALCWKVAPTCAVQMEEQWWWRPSECVPWLWVVLMATGYSVVYHTVAVTVRERLSTSLFASFSLCAHSQLTCVCLVVPVPSFPFTTPPLHLRGTIISQGSWYFTCTVLVPGPGAVGFACVTPGATADSLGERWVLHQVDGGAGGSILRVETPSGPTVSLPGPVEGSRLDAWRAGDVVGFALDTHSGVLTVTLWSKWPAPGGWTSPGPAMYDGSVLPQPPACGQLNLVHVCGVFMRCGCAVDVLWMCGLGSYTVPVAGLPVGASFTPVFVLEGGTVLGVNFGNEPFTLPPPAHFLSVRRYLTLWAV